MGHAKDRKWLGIFSFQRRNILLRITNEQTPKPENLMASCRDITKIVARSI